MSKIEDEKRSKDELAQKNVAYYQTMFSALIESRNEFDRQLLTISVASLGFLWGMLDKITSGCLSRFFVALASIFFVATIISLLIIFSLNSNYLEKELRSEADSAAKVSRDLRLYDVIAKWLFGIALAISLAVFLLRVFEVPRAI